MPNINPLSLDTLKIVTKTINNVQSGINNISTTTNLPLNVVTITGTYTVTPEQSGTTFLVNASSGNYTIYLPSQTDLAPGIKYRFISKVNGHLIHIMQQTPTSHIAGMLFREFSNDSDTQFDNIDITNNPSILFINIPANPGDYIEFTVLPSGILSVYAFSGVSEGLYLT
jgi:hypothetical protein